MALAILQWTFTNDHLNFTDNTMRYGRYHLIDFLFSEGESGQSWSWRICFLPLLSPSPFSVSRASMDGPVRCVTFTEDL